MALYTVDFLGSGLGGSGNYHRLKWNGTSIWHSRARQNGIGGGELLLEFHVRFQFRFPFVGIRRMVPICTPSMRHCSSKGFLLGAPEPPLTGQMYRGQMSVQNRHPFSCSTTFERVLAVQHPPDSFSDQNRPNHSRSE